METNAHTLGSWCDESTLFPVSPTAPRSLSLVCGGPEPSGEAAAPGAGAAGHGVKMNEAGTSEPHTSPRIIPQATGSVNTWNLLVNTCCRSSAERSRGKRPTDTSRALSVGSMPWHPPRSMQSGTGDHVPAHTSFSSRGRAALTKDKGPALPPRSLWRARGVCQRNSL